jgi:hypothetical protein
MAVCYGNADAFLKNDPVWFSTFWHDILYKQSMMVRTSLRFVSLFPPCTPP